MSEKRSYGSSGGFSLGSVIAAVLSVVTWGPSWWLLLHVPLGWLFVIYWMIFLWGKP